MTTEITDQEEMRRLAISDFPPAPIYDWSPYSRLMNYSRSMMLTDAIVKLIMVVGIYLRPIFVFVTVAEEVDSIF